MSVDATWLSNMDLMGNSLHVRDSRNARTQSHIWKRWVFRARNAAKKWFTERRKKAADIMGVRIIRSVISCHGRSQAPRNVQNAEAIWWKKEINLFAVKKPVDM